MPTTMQLAKSLGVSIEDIHDQFDILETDGAIKVIHMLSAVNNDTASITGVGKKILEQAQSGWESESFKSIPTGTDEALELFEQVTSALCTSYDLLACLRKCLHGIRIVGWDEVWIIHELNGYPKDQIPPWRKVSGFLTWVGEGLADNVSLTAATTVKSMNGIKDMPTRIDIYNPITELIANQEIGFTWGTGKTKVVKPIREFITVHEIKKVDPSAIKRILDLIANKLFNYASKAVVTLKFGQVVASVFNKYQLSVESGFTRLGIENDLKTAYQNLMQDNPASWQAAVMACRNIMHKLSEVLWQSSEKTHPYLEAKDGSPMVVDRDKIRNRIRAYLHEKGVKNDDLLMNMIDALYSMASAGKQPISYEHAQSVIIYTYIFLGEMVRLTDMLPVTEVLRK